MSMCTVLLCCWKRVLVMPSTFVAVHGAGGMWGDFPHPRPRAEKPQQDGRRGKIMFTIKPIPARDAKRTQTNLVHTRTQRLRRDWDRTVSECLLWGSGSVSAVGCCRGRGSGCSRLECGIALLEEVTINPTTDSRRMQTEPCAPGPRRKEQWPHKRLAQTCLWVPRSLRWRRGYVVACRRVGSYTECSSAYMGPFECHYYLHLHHYITSTIVWPQANNREGTQPHP